MFSRFSKAFWQVKHHVCKGASLSSPQKCPKCDQSVTSGKEKTASFKAVFRVPEDLYLGLMPRFFG